MIRLLGIDPGFANTGYVLAQYDGEELDLLEMGVICTAPAQKKVPKYEDKVRRLLKINEQLLFKMLHADAVCAEAMSFTPNASSSAKVAMVWGVIASCLEGRPLVQRQPQEIKEAVCGVKSASKAKVETALSRRFEDMYDLLSGVSASRREHPIDALGAIVASLDSEVVKMGVRR